jgi:glucan phosphoethanolaminetransferase (alkaline phosphatase superfamily)
MIQRKQTLFLLGVLIIAIAQFFIPFQTFTNESGNFPICLMPGCSAEIIGNNIYIALIFNCIIIILSLIIVFLYKNRVLQHKLANLLAVFNMFLIGLFFILSYTKDGQMEAISYQFGAFLPIISAIFSYLAAHFIKKDEQLVRSADRIR